MSLRDWRLLALGAALMLCPAARGDEPPPDRLEKKPAPAEPKRPEPPKPAEKASDDKEKPADDSAEGAAKLREQIAEDMQSVEKKLKDRDPGRETRDMQDRALRNLDKLIDLARNPPPAPPQQPPMGGEQQPQGGKPQSQPQSGQSRRQKREQRRQQMQQQAGAGQQPRPQSQAGARPGGGEQLGKSGTQPGMAGPGSPRPPEQLSDVVKDFWGHLPETLRQEVDHYYRDRFMPRYRDLLQEYYSRIAERDRGRPEDR